MKKPLSESKKTVSCPDCNGRGWKWGPDQERDECFLCDGNQVISEQKYKNMFYHPDGTEK